MCLVTKAQIQQVYLLHYKSNKNIVYDFMNMDILPL